MLAPIGVAIIEAEYTRLCHVFGLREVPLDIYEADPDSEVEERTPFGTDRRNTDPAYSGTKKLLVLPILAADQPTTLPPFPPETWTKLDWKSWQLELWHEVIHQISDEVFGAWDPNEPGYTRDNGTPSLTGHGVGFRRALDYAAAKLGTTRRQLEQVLDE